MEWRFGFEVYDASGKLVKSNNNGCIRGYAVSNRQKFFAVTSSPIEEDANYFVLYDTDGNELWRIKIAEGGTAIIQFSLDDKFAIVKMPFYWEGDRKELRKIYLFNTESMQIVSEGNYEK